jgi:hypothetical protein
MAYAWRENGLAAAAASLKHRRRIWRVASAAVSIYLETRGIACLMTKACLAPRITISEGGRRGIMGMARSADVHAARRSVRSAWRGINQRSAAKRHDLVGGRRREKRRTAASRQGGTASRRGEIRRGASKSWAE